MTKFLVAIPSILDLPTSLMLSERLAQVKGADEFIVEFSGSTHVEPFSMLMVSSEIQRAVERNPGVRFECRNHEKMTYAAHMGFFRAFGFDHRRQPSETRGSIRYLPLTLLRCAELRDQALSEGKEVGTVIEEHAQQLATMLCVADKGDVHATLSYALREIMRNVVEHSEGSQLGVCAQYWPTQSKVEVAIFDRGVGLRATLSRNPHLSVEDDRAALNLAQMPAVSGKTYKGARPQRGPWANSGFGLYMTSRICRNGGSFFLASGSRGMLLARAKQGKQYLSCSYQGTAVRLVIRTDQISSLRESLAQYREDGAKIQQKYKEIVKINPSAASLMLSEDFDVSAWDRFLAALK